MIEKEKMWSIQWGGSPPPVFQKMDYTDYKKITQIILISVIRI